MIRHIVMWNFKDGFTAEEIRENAQKIKSDLENLINIIPGLISLEVITNTCPTSNRDLVLNSLFASEEALAAYQVHPAHVQISQYGKNILTNRCCADFIEDPLNLK